MSQTPANRQPLKGSQRPPLAESNKMEPVSKQDRIMVTIILRSKFPDRERFGHDGDFSKPRTERKFMNHETFADQYGAYKQELEEVAEFARSFDLQVTLAHSGRRSVVVEGTAENINKAFGVTLYRYVSDKGSYHGFEGLVMLPPAILKLVESVIGLDNRPLNARHFAGDSNDPASTGLLTPQAVAARYHFPPGSGIGQTIGIYEMATSATPSPGFTTSDLTLTLNGFGGGLSVPTITEVPIDSQVNSGVTDAETMLDIAVASAVANSAAIAVYFAPLNAQGILHALHAMVHPLAGQPVPTVISISYSWDFDDLTNLLSDDDYSQLSKLFRDAADLWITTLASTGDSGATWGTSRAYACFPATDPNVLACGGTTVGPLKMGIDSFDEYVWNDAKGTTGGGVSDRFGIPSYQTALTLPVQINTSKTGRGTPDVSGNASPNSGYTLFIGGISSGWGGTSAVAPLYAGLVAIVNEQLKAAGSLYPAGFINSLLYEQAATLCRDVTAAAGPTNNGFSGGPGYTAGIGWDACTGLGSIRGNQLLHAIRPLTCQIVYKKSDNCDQGPLENTVAVFLAEITGGAGPFNYAWVPGNAAPPPGGSLTGQKVSIAVPPAGTTFTLTLTVTDISLIPVTVTASFVSLNPEVAGIGHALCEFIHWGYEFKQPIYISPGDPYRNGIFTLQELINLHAAATRVANLTGSLLKNRLTFETGELQGVIL